MPGKTRNVSVLILSLLLLIVACTPYCSLVEAEKSYAQHDYYRAFQQVWPLAYCSAKAQYALGYMYFYGLGIARDENLARDWFQQAGSRNYYPAIIALKDIMNGHEIQYVPFARIDKVPGVQM